MEQGGVAWAPQRSTYPRCSRPAPPTSPVRAFHPSRPARAAMPPHPPYPSRSPAPTTASLMELGTTARMTLSARATASRATTPDATRQPASAFSMLTPSPRTCSGSGGGSGISGYGGISGDGGINVGGGRSSGLRVRVASLRPGCCPRQDPQDLSGQRWPATSAWSPGVAP